MYIEQLGRSDNFQTALRHNLNHSAYYYSSNCKQQTSCTVYNINFTLQTAELFKLLPTMTSTMQ